MFYSLKSEMQHCPACQSQDIRHLDIFTHKKVQPKKFVWFISGCDNCGLVFINPQPSQQRLDEFYAPEGGWVKEKVQKHIESGALAVTAGATADGLATKAMKTSKQRDDDDDELDEDDETPEMSQTKASGKSAVGAPIWRAIRGLPYKSGAVFDFGCGTGTLLTTMKQRGWTTYGLDPATAPLLRDQGHIMVDEMPDTPMFDLIVIKHVLEHLPDPLTVLKQARKCIKPGGHLYVGTPTLDRLSEHQKKDYCINNSKHISAFTRRSMQNLLALAGFQIVSDYETVRMQRLAVLAAPANDCPRVPNPLADAERELTDYMILTEGRREGAKPIRWRAASANNKELAARGMEKISQARRAARGFIYALASRARANIAKFRTSPPNK